MNNSVEQIKRFITNGGTPEQLVANLIKTNPQLKSVTSLVQNGNKNDIESFARNMFKEQGRDFDKEFEAFMNYFK